MTGDDFLSPLAFLNIQTEALLGDLYLCATHLMQYPSICLVSAEHSAVLVQHNYWLIAR